MSIFHYERVSDGYAEAREMPTSPRTVVRMVLRMTGHGQSLSHDTSWYIEHTIPLDAYHGSSRVGHTGGVRQPMPPAKAGYDMMMRVRVA
jgi:hypothetical protein